MCSWVQWIEKDLKVELKRNQAVCIQSPRASMINIASVTQWASKGRAELVPPEPNTTKMELWEKKNPEETEQK